MSASSKPVVYISYAWLDGTAADGSLIPVADERAEKLADRLREAGFDSRLDKYFHESRHGFAPPQRRAGDTRKPWWRWAEEQITESHCVLMLCTPEYAMSDPDRGRCPGAWCDWHLQADDLKSQDVRALWWDWHCIARDSVERPEKFIPVGYGPYDSSKVPAFVEGANYYDLDSERDFKGLRHRIRMEYQKQHPRQGVFISYAHDDDHKWLKSLLTHLAPLEQRGVDIWTDLEIKPGDRWHEDIQDSLARAKVAVMMVSPEFLSSSYIASHELPEMLSAAESEGLTIFPIPLKYSSYEQSGLRPFQAARPLSEPLSNLRGSKLDQAFVEIASKLADALGLGKS
jgi:hypothetical protein